MRELTTGTNIHTTVAAVDEPSHGACHIYEVIMTDPSDKALGYNTRTQRIMFQKGPVKEHGVNGIHNEDLLCILIDRFEGFQRGEYHCPENGFVLTYLQGALARLRDRTQRRQAAGIEGTSAKDPMCGKAQAKADEQNTERGEAVEEKAYQPSTPDEQKDEFFPSYRLSDDKKGLCGYFKDGCIGNYAHIHSDEMTAKEKAIYAQLVAESPPKPEKTKS